MKMQNVTLAQFAYAVAQANTDYAGNLAVHADAHEIGSRKITTVGRLTVKESHDDGARYSWAGRHCQAACWHAFRDVYREIFSIAPDAVITTTLARYTKENFETVYPQTAFTNVGSQFQPVTMPELCTGPCVGDTR